MKPLRTAITFIIIARSAVGNPFEQEEDVNLRDITPHHSERRIKALQSDISSVGETSLQSVKLQTEMRAKVDPASTLHIPRVAAVESRSQQVSIVVQSHGVSLLRSTDQDREYELDRTKPELRSVGGLGRPTKARLETENINNSMGGRLVDIWRLSKDTKKRGNTAQSDVHMHGARKALRSVGPFAKIKAALVSLRLSAAKRTTSGHSEKSVFVYLIVTIAFVAMGVVSVRLLGGSFGRRPNFGQEIRRRMLQESNMSAGAVGASAAHQQASPCSKYRQEPQSRTSSPEEQEERLPESRRERTFITQKSSASPRERSISPGDRISVRRDRPRSNTLNTAPSPRAQLQSISMRSPRASSPAARQPSHTSEQE